MKNKQNLLINELLTLSQKVQNLESGVKLARGPSTIINSKAQYISFS